MHTHTQMPTYIYMTPHSLSLLFLCHPPTHADTHTHCQTHIIMHAFVCTTRCVMHICKCKHWHSGSSDSAEPGFRHLNGQALTLSLLEDSRFLNCMRDHFWLLNEFCRFVLQLTSWSHASNLSIRQWPIQWWTSRAAIQARRWIQMSFRHMLGMEQKQDWQLTIDKCTVNNSSIWGCLPSIWEFSRTEAFGPQLSYMIYIYIYMCVCALCVCVQCMRTQRSIAQRLPHFPQMYISASALKTHMSTPHDGHAPPHRNNALITRECVHTRAR